MQYTKLGKSDLHVSRVCLGCMGFGDAAHGQHSWTLDEEASRAIIRRALEWGVGVRDALFHLAPPPSSNNSSSGTPKAAAMCCAVVR